LILFTLVWLPKIDELPDFNGGLVGYFGYEIIRYIEPKLAKISQPDELGMPDILLTVSWGKLKKLKKRKVEL
jgi:anthranilate/para-aminobenzoate synthase component I